MAERTSWPQAIVTAREDVYTAQATSGYQQRATHIGISALGTDATGTRTANRESAICRLTTV